MGDGYSACVMAASAHAIRGWRQRGRGAEGGGGGRVCPSRVSACGALGSPAPSRSPGRGDGFPGALLGAARPAPPPPALGGGCHFAHIDDRGGAFPQRFPATGADRCGRGRPRAVDSETARSRQPRAARPRRAVGCLAGWGRGDGMFATGGRFLVSFLALASAVWASGAGELERGAACARGGCCGGRVLWAGPARRRRPARSQRARGCREPGAGPGRGPPHAAEYPTTHLRLCCGAFFCLVGVFRTLS